MIKAGRVFIIDFDNTILDIERLKKHISSQFPNKSIFEREYKKAKFTSGHFNPENLPGKYRSIFLNAPFKKYLFPGAISGLKALQKKGRVIIFSFGNNSYQNTKIAKSGVEKLIGKNNVLVVQNKKEGIGKLIRSLKKEKFSDITVVDDVAEVLEKAFVASPQTITTWIRYGKYKNKLPIMRNAITHESGSFTDAVDFAHRFITAITISKSHIKFPVLRDIDEKQITDLVSYTGRDKKISVCTHDDGRFKNKKTFKSWRARGKTIYTLTNRSGKLLGIIWFARKKYKNFPYTLDVRTYPPIRGKGLSHKFMKAATDDFVLSHKKTGLWLSMQKGNIPAEKLYKKFGFVKKEERKSEVIMTFLKS